MTTPPIQAPFFDANGLPAARDAFVIWLDVMGVRGWMLRSLPVTANFIFKLHVAVLEEKQPDMELYPVMDGVYVVSPDVNGTRTFLSRFFARLACLFAATTQHEHQFLIKGAVACGQVIHGSEISAIASNALNAAPEYKDSILMGMPMVFALQSEPHAPPFGGFVHDSARSLLNSQERKRSHHWWPWFSAGGTAEARLLRQHLPAYFDWCEARAGAIDYDINRSRAHKALALQYLVEA